jgi:hypothetical protein
MGRVRRVFPSCRFCQPIYLFIGTMLARLCMHNQSLVIDSSFFLSFSLLLAVTYITELLLLNIEIFLKYI